jgi:hypothetical protein
MAMPLLTVADEVYPSVMQFCWFPVAPEVDNPPTTIQPVPAPDGIVELYPMITPAGPVEVDMEPITTFVLAPAFPAARFPITTEAPWDTTDPPMATIPVPVMVGVSLKIMLVLFDKISPTPVTLWPPIAMLPDIVPPASGR